MVAVSRRRRLPSLARPQRHERTVAGHVSTVLVFVVAGLLITISSIAARGTDLRSDRNLSLRDIIIGQAQRNTQLQQELDGLRADVDTLSSQDFTLDQLHRDIDEAELTASASEVSGPGLRVTLSDAPSDVKPAGVDDDALVVHQQDIQTVVNALWAGGAEAITIQGQRVISTTGIKCVGNTVVLHGIPYAPPYVVEAIGDADAMQRSLDSTPAVQIYRQYVDAYGLGYSVERVAQLDMPGVSGLLGVTYAHKQ